MKKQIQIPTDLLPVTFQITKQFEDKRIDPVTFHRMASTFYEGEKWAVRYLSYCLSKFGEWESEPTPSCRDAHFYERFRFDTLEEALEAYHKSN